MVIQQCEHSVALLIHLELAFEKKTLKSMLLLGFCRPYRHIAPALGASAESGLAAMRGIYSPAHGIMPVRALSKAPAGARSSQAAAHV